MTFNSKFDIASNAFINYCKESIVDAYNEYYNTGMFGMWLDMDADMVFAHGYEDTFKEQFGDLISPEIVAKFFFACKNIIYAIKTFILMKGNNYNIQDMTKFVEYFVTTQLCEFDNDYQEYNVSSWLHNDTEEEETDDNPV